MLEYVLKSSACMIVFLLFYQFLLEKENMHQFKRFFLLAALIASLVIPKLVFIEYAEAVPSTVSAVPGPAAQQVEPSTAQPISDMDVVNWSKLFRAFYLLGVLGFGLRFGAHLYQILRRIRKNQKLKGKTVTKVLLKEQLPPHTFFRYVFLNKEKYEANTIPGEVMLHEETHARQYHSFDVLFVELVQVILWFNPLLLLFKRNIKLNHEFLADRAVLKEKVNTQKYQNTLLSYVSRDSEAKYQSIKMANAINYSSIKKRFTIMKKETSKTSIALRIVLLLPIPVVLLYGFSTTKTIYPISKENIAPLVVQEGASREQMGEYNALAKKYNQFLGGSISKKEIEQMTYIHNRMSEKQRQDAQPFPSSILDKWSPQKGASRAQMKEYNALAKRYNAMTKEAFHIKRKEVERMQYIYDLMSEKQRADAEPFPEILEPPMPPEPPTPGFTNPETPEPPTFPAPITAENQIGHIKEVAQKGAIFYLEGERTSVAKIIEILEKEGPMNIMTRHTGDSDFVVRVSSDPEVPKE